MYISNNFLGNADIPGLGSHFENHWPMLHPPQKFLFKITPFHFPKLPLFHRTHWKSAVWCSHHRLPASCPWGLRPRLCSAQILAGHTLSSPNSSTLAQPSDNRSPISQTCLAIKCLPQAKLKENSSPSGQSWIAQIAGRQGCFSPSGQKLVRISLCVRFTVGSLCENSLIINYWNNYFYNWNSYYLLGSLCALNSIALAFSSKSWEGNLRKRVKGRGLTLSRWWTQSAQPAAGPGLGAELKAHHSDCGG